jgi:hypothetical protein
VNVEQRSDDLQVVLDAVVDLADQPALARQRVAHLPLRFLDALDRALEGRPSSRISSAGPSRSGAQTIVAGW